jgi:demethylspheroidene O-methyltransferase
MTSQESTLAAKPMVLQAVTQSKGWRMRLLASWRSWRNQQLMSLKFHRFVACIPGLRAVGNRHSRALVNIATGFVHTQVLFSCVELGIFDHLAKGALSVSDIAQRSGLSHERADRLLRAAVSLKLLEWTDCTDVSTRSVGLGMLGAALLGAPGVRQMMVHNQLLYRDLVDPVAMLRDPAKPTELSSYWPYAAKADGEVGAPRDGRLDHYSDLMAQSQVFVADDVRAAFDMRGVEQLMDIGGGDGTFLRAMAAGAPATKLVLFDLPPVAQLAQGKFKAAALSNPFETVGGSFRTDALPQGADVISLVRVLHDHDDDVVAALLTKVHESLPDGGRLLVAEPMAETKGAESFADAYFGFYFLAMGTGRARSPAALISLMKQAGFAEISVIPTRRPIVTSLIIAHKSTSLGVNTK